MFVLQYKSVGVGVGAVILQDGQVIDRVSSVSSDGGFGALFLGLEALGALAEGPSELTVESDDEDVVSQLQGGELTDELRQKLDAALADFEGWTLTARCIPTFQLGTAEALARASDCYRVEFDCVASEDGVGVAAVLYKSQRLRCRRRFFQNLSIEKGASEALLAALELALERASTSILLVAPEGGPAAEILRSFAEDDDELLERARSLSGGLESIRVELAPRVFATTLAEEAFDDRIPASPALHNLRHFSNRLRSAVDDVVGELKCGCCSPRAAFLNPPGSPTMRRPSYCSVVTPSCGSSPTSSFRSTLLGDDDDLLLEEEDLDDDMVVVEKTTPTAKIDAVLKSQSPAWWRDRLDISHPLASLLAATVLGDWGAGTILHMLDLKRFAKSRSASVSVATFDATIEEDYAWPDTDNFEDVDDDCVASFVGVLLFRFLENDFSRHLRIVCEQAFSLEPLATDFGSNVNRSEWHYAVYSKGDDVSTTPDDDDDDDDAQVQFRFVVHCSDTEIQGQRKFMVQMTLDSDTLDPDDTDIREVFVLFKFLVLYRSTTELYSLHLFDDLPTCLRCTCDVSKTCLAHGVGDVFPLDAFGPSILRLLPPDY